MSKNITFTNCTGYDILIKRKTAQMKNNIKHMNKNESLVSNIYGDPYNGNVLKISRDAKDETHESKWYQEKIKKHVAPYTHCNIHESSQSKKQFCIFSLCFPATYKTVLRTVCYDSSSPLSCSQTK